MENLDSDYFRKGQKIIEFSVDGDERIFRLENRHTYTFGKSKLTIPTPNISGIFLNAAEKQLVVAREIYSNNIKPLLSLTGETALDEIQSAHLFKYLEHIQLSIITLYTAIESLANSLIPDDYLFHEEKNGGSLLMDKPYIERNKSTGFKLDVVLPDALEIKSPRFSSHWSNFKKLEEIRNNIIHLKTDALTEGDLDKNLMYSLIKPSIFKILLSTIKLISELTNTIEDGYKAPILNEKDSVFRMIFQDWELFEEYFVAKGLLPPIKNEENENTISTAADKTAKAFNIITRIK